MLVTSLQIPLQMVADNSICNTLCGDRKLLKLRVYTWKLQYPYIDTPVSMHGNWRIPTRKLQFPAWKREFRRRELMKQK